ncbi:MAG TPA: hypothetical protein DDW72_20360, partial [Afipia sp.]|nr:hypothetical protein [Afipia sp.]
GDGVNTAARLEGIAAPGGISVSEDAWRQVNGKVSATFVDRGEKRLKKIAASNANLQHRSRRTACGVARLSCQLPRPSWQRQPAEGRTQQRSDCCAC